MAVNLDQKVKDWLTAIRNGPVKMYRVLDVSNRIQYQYEANVTAVTGDACMVTEYIYSGTTSTVIKMKEYVRTWDSSWDLVESAP